MNAKQYDTSEASFENNIATSVNVSSSNTPSTPNEKGDPSSEWASSTLEALVPVTIQTHVANEPFYTPANMSVSTPGSISQLVPGAFPASANPSTVLLQIEEQNKEDAKTMPNANAQYVKEVTTSALGTAREYAVRTGETVGGYLPESIAVYLPSSPKSTTNGNSLSTESDSNEHPVPTLKLSSDDENSTKIAPSIKRDPSRAASMNGAQTETMRKGLQIVKEENHTSEHPESANTNEPNHEQTERSTLSPTEASGDEYRVRGGQSEAGADTDASTRSLVGTQVDRSLYTPGTSLFSRKWQDDGQSVVASSAHGASQDETAGESIPATGNTGAPVLDARTPVASEVPDSHDAAKRNTEPHDMKTPTKDNEDTQARSQSHHQEHPVHRAMPVTDGREHPIPQGPTGSGAQVTTGPASPQRPNGGDSKPESVSTGWERVDSSRATPGHGPPPVPRKDNESAAISARQTTAQAAGANVVAASASAGAGAGGDLGGAGAGNAAGATSAKTKSVHAHAHGASANGDGSHKNGTEGKKSGFFEKLKREMRALSGKHHKEDSARKDMSKN